MFLSISCRSVPAGPSNAFDQQRSSTANRYSTGRRNLQRRRHADRTHALRLEGEQHDRKSTPD
jgi:hypothetical protein